MATHVKFRLALLTVAFLAMVWGFHVLLFNHLPVIVSDPVEDLSFARVIPFFSLYIIWIERKQLVNSLGEPSLLGLLSVLPCLLIGFLGARGLQVRFELLAFIGLLVTIPWALFGRRTAARLLVPVGFLLFCIPLASFLDILTVHLRLLSSSVAYSILRGFGAEVFLQGSMIGAVDGSFAIDVADPCSGIRSFSALMALTAFYAYLTQKTWLKRGFLFALAVPLTVLGNIMRLLSICLVAKIASPDFATGFYHDYSGYVVYFVAIGIMVCMGEWLKK